MKKAFIVDKMKIDVKEVETPKVGPKDILLRPAYVGICGSEVQMYRLGYHPASAESFLNNPENVRAQLWRKIGHEASGTVVEVGSEVKAWREGDRYWSNDIEGSFSEYVLVSEDAAKGRLHHLPNELSFEQGALIEPTQVALIALSKAGEIEGKNVVILGGGTIGLLALQGAKACGASSVIVSEVNPLRIEKAWELGADEVINPFKTDIVKRVMRLTEGLGADIMIDTAGKQETFEQMVRILRPGDVWAPSCGRGIIVAWWEQPITFNLNWIVKKNLEIVGSKAPHTQQQLEWLYKHHPLRMVKEGKIKVEPLITSKVPLDQIDEAFQEILKGKHLKVLVHP